MRKQEFLTQLRQRLSGLPRQDMEERLNFYSEMIDDRMEEGLPEEDAVAAVGSVDEIAAQITADIPPAQPAPEKPQPRKQLSTWEILLLVLGSPVWLPLLIAAFSVVLSLSISLWAVIISLWAVFASLAACSVGGVLACIVFAVSGNGTSGLAMLAVGIALAGLSIFAFYGCKAVTDSTWFLTKKLAIRIKNGFINKEAVS